MCSRKQVYVCIENLWHNVFYLVMQIKNGQMSALRSWEIDTSFFKVKNCATVFYKLSRIIVQFVANFVILLKHIVKRVVVVV